MRPRVEQDVPLQAVNVYESFITLPAVAVIQVGKVHQIFDLQTLTYTGAVRSQLVNGQLPDGRPGTLLGMHIRALQPEIGQTTGLTVAGDIEGVLQHYRFRLLVADIVIVQAPVCMFPSPGQVRTSGVFNETPTNGDTTTKTFLSGPGVPFDPHPINANERVRIELIEDPGVIHGALNLAIGVTVSDVRKAKKSIG